MAKSKQQEYKVGDSVLFTGYSQPPEEGQDLLVEGETYPVIEVGEESVVVEVPNPDFNSKKKVTEDNPEFIETDAFFDEIELAAAGEESGDEGGEEVEEVEEVPAKTAAKGKAAAKPAAAAKGKVESKGATKPAAKAETKGKAAAKPAGKAKAAPVEEEKDEPYTDLSDEVESEEVLSLVADASDDELLEIAREAADEESAVVFKLAGILYHVRASGAYKKLGKQYAEKGGFGLYTEDVLGIAYRKAMYLIEIYYNWCKFGLEPSKIAEIGWTKASQIVSIMTEENAEELVTQAENSTVEELKESVKEGRAKLGKDSRETVKFTTFKFRLMQHSGETVTETLNSVAKAMGFEGKNAMNEAFEHIVMEWAAEHPLNETSTAGKKTVATKPGTAGSKPKAKVATKA